jgi:recombination protein RecT
MTAIEPTQKPQPKNIVEYIKLDSIQESAERALGTGGRQFLTSILSFANSNTAIMECEPRSVYAACLTAATLDLSVNPNLGQAYILPYKNKGVMQAQFQIGYRGFIQLSIRSGEFQRIGANEVYDGQLAGYDDFSGEPIFDFNAGQQGEIIGYMAYFQLTNGFRKVSFMPKEKVEKHAKKYSQSYKANFGPWKDNFDGMAKKTVLKLLLSKFAPLNTEMQRALEEDQKVADEYADNKITFEVEGATIEGEPIETPEPYIEETIEVEEPQLIEEMITGPQLKKLVVITDKLPDDLKEVELKARELNYPGRSRKTFTKVEAMQHIDYIIKLTEGEY